MQIRELVIYGKNGKVRRLPFNLGKVNIIIGKSSSGKSAVGAIIDYCLGGNSCNIADGCVRDNAAWYGLLLQFEQDRMFVARQNPPPTQQSTSACYVEIGKDIEVHDVCDFAANENVAGLEETLSRHLGIAENLHTPPDGQSRQPLEANIRHALFYCFQKQDEIASPNILFHRQHEDFVTQSIKDTLPYFLGIVNEDSLALESELTRLKRQLIIEKRRFEESMMIRGGGMERAVSLIAESKQAGLIDPDLTVDYDDYDAVSDALDSVNIWQPQVVQTAGLDRLTYLQTELEKYERELDEINIEIDNARKYIGETSEYTVAATHQTMRLSSIGLFEKLDFDPNHCPLCSNDIDEQALPTANAIKTAINDLNRGIENIAREKPKIREYIDSLEKTRQELRETLQNTRTEIDGVYNQNETAKQIRDLNVRRAHVSGRVSLWLDSVKSMDNTSGKVETIGRLETRIAEIEAQLNREALEERKTSALNRISVNMSSWAKELRLEHGDNPYRLDMNKVTVVVDKPERPIPLKQLGSGSNWVGVHLITYFSLQKYFVDANRPVPRFMFIDQPSQVYFPSERKEKRQDWERIGNLYNFIFNRTNELNNQVQLIIVDHADLTNDQFRGAVIEDWLDDDNLIPKEWYEEKQD